MSETLIHIGRHRCDNAGGVVRVKVVLPEDVLSYTSDTEEAGVELKPGKEVYHIGVDPFTGYHYEKLNANGDQGDFHTRGVGFDIRRLRQDKVTFRRRIMNRRVHVIFTDENGETLLYLNQRLRKANADNQYRQKNKTEFEFSGSGVLPAPYVIGELLPGPGEEDVPDLPNTGGNPITDPGAPGDDPGDGSAGGDPDDDLGDGNPDPGGDPGGDPDPDPTPNEIRILQPSTGDEFTLTLGPCEEPIFTKIVP